MIRDMVWGAFIIIIITVIAIIAHSSCGERPSEQDIQELMKEMRYIPQLTEEQAIAEVKAFLEESMQTAKEEIAKETKKGRQDMISAWVLIYEINRCYLEGSWSATFLEYGKWRVTSVPKLTYRRLLVEWAMKVELSTRHWIFDEWSREVYPEQE